ncbi:MAG: 4Fe-4S dicluster domain-containing protein [Halanaerobiales bacterium]
MNSNFKNEVSKRPGGENLNLCYSCGSCTATCPVSEVDTSFNPRLIIKKTQLGFKEEVLNNDDLWKCVQCRRCVAHCPQNVKFADIIRVLRNMAIEEGYYPETMIDNLDHLDQTLLKYRLAAVLEHLQDKKDIEEVIKEVEAGGDSND